MRTIPGGKLMKPTLLVSFGLFVAAACALAPALSQPASSQPTWQQSQQRDAADTYNFSRFTLVGRFLHPPQQVSDRPALRVDCIPGTGSHRSKFLTADLLVGKTLKILYVEPEEIRGTNYFPKIGVSYSTDGSTHANEQWPAGTDRVPTAKPSDKTSANIPLAALKKMIGAHTVTISTPDEHGASIEMQFDMPSADAIEAACSIE
jgi:hypothetical protein